MQKKTYEDNLKQWIKDEKAAIELIGLLGKLWFDKSVELILFRHQMMDRSASELLQLHHYAQEFAKRPIYIHTTLAIAKVLAKSDLAPARIDIGRLGVEWTNSGDKYATMEAMIEAKLGDFMGKEEMADAPLAPPSINST